MNWTAETLAADVARPKVCPTCGRSRKRTNPQLRRYFALVSEVSRRIPDEAGNYHSKRNWHLYFKSEFLGYRDLILPSGKMVQILPSTEDLSVEEMNEYMTKVEVWAAERDVTLPE